MIKIKQMYHKQTGEIVFEDENGQWWQQEYQEFNKDFYSDDFAPVVATKIDKPEEITN